MLNSNKDLKRTIFGFLVWCMLLLLIVLFVSELSDSLADQRIGESFEQTSNKSSEYISGVKSYYNRTSSAVLAFIQIFIVIEMTLLFLPKKEDRWWRSYLNVFLMGLLFLSPIFIFPVFYMSYSVSIIATLIAYNVVIYILCVSLLMILYSICKSKLFPVFFMQMLYFIFLGTIFYSNPIIESAKNTLSRTSIINFLLAINPMATVSSIIDVDLLRMPYSYDKCVIQYYTFEYPGTSNVLYTAIIMFLLIAPSLFLFKQRYNKLFNIEAIEGEAN